MVNPLSVASNGYLYPDDNWTLSVSVDGYLIEILIPPAGGGGGVGGGRHHNKNYEENKLDIYKEEDEEILLIIKSFVISEN